MSINLWKVWAALQRPKGILRNSYRPSGVMIAVLAIASLARGIW